MQLDVAKNGGKVKQYISLDSISSHQMLSYDAYILDKLSQERPVLNFRPHM